MITELSNSESSLYKNVASDPLPEVLTKIQLPKFLSLTFCQLDSIKKFFCYSYFSHLPFFYDFFGNFSRYSTK